MMAFRCLLSGKRVDLKFSRYPQRRGCPMKESNSLLPGYALRLALVGTVAEVSPLGAHRHSFRGTTMNTFIKEGLYCAPLVGASRSSASPRPEPPRHPVRPGPTESPRAPGRQRRGRARHPERQRHQRAGRFVGASGHNGRPDRARRCPAGPRTHHNRHRQRQRRAHAGKINPCYRLQSGDLLTG